MHHSLFASHKSAVPCCWSHLWPNPIS